MGTNYFFIDEKGNSFHIGKSSSGWEFIWRTQYSLNIASPNQWRAFLESKVFCEKMKSIKIEDESFKQISTYDFLHSVADNNVRKKFSKQLKKINEKEYINSGYDVRRYTEDYYDMKNTEGDVIFNFDFS